MGLITPRSLTCSKCATSTDHISCRTPGLLFQIIDSIASTMGTFSVQQMYLLACLTSLTAAIPNPLTSQATTLLTNSFSNILSNSTLGEPVIPSDFTIRPSPPLDEPVLDRRNTLLLTLHALSDLAVLDYLRSQQTQTWRAVQHVSIDIIGPAKTLKSFIPVRKYALWGIYKAIQLMVASEDFRSRNFDLLHQGVLVGYVAFNNGPLGVLGIEDGSANETNPAVQQVDLSTSSLTLLENTTTTNVQSNDIHIDFKAKGRTIGEDNVFMTLFTGILKVAPQYATEFFDSFSLNTRTFNSALTCKARRDIGPGESRLGYSALIRVFKELPLWVLTHGGGSWNETDFLVWESMGQRYQVLGAGILRWQARQTIA